MASSLKAIADEAGAPIWRQIRGADDISAEETQRHTLALLQRGLELQP